MPENERDEKNDVCRQDVDVPKRQPPFENTFATC